MQLALGTLGAGEPLCGAIGLVFDPEPGLFQPIVSCQSCTRIAARCGVLITDALSIAS